MAWIENKIIEFSKTQRFSLYALGDFQIGSESCNRSLIKRAVRDITKDKDAMVVILGDIEDEDRPSTRVMRDATFAGRREVKTRDGDKHKAWVNEQVLPILEPLTKMKHGIIGVLAGHHWTQMNPEQNSVEYICEKLSDMSGRAVPYMGEMSGWIYLRFRGVGGLKGKAVTKLVHIQHGTGGGQTLASALNRLEKTAQGFPADVYIRAHDCKLVAAKTVEVFPKESMKGLPELRHKDIALLNIGSATRGYNITKGAPDYVESAMMRPTAMGWGAVHFDIRSSMTWEDNSANMRADIKVEL
jgi:hypothetical protein